MNKYRAAFGFLLFAASLPSVSEVSAALPELLRERNFNLFSAACPANEMLLQNVNGGTISLSSLRGKVVILNFWKIDCPPCSVEKPILERIRQKYAGRGLEIVAVNLFDTGDRLKSYCQCGHFGFTFAFDPENRFSVRKQNLPSGVPTSFVINSSAEAIYEVPGVPTTYLINKKGEVVGNSVGMVNWEEAPFVELLESLLGPAPQMVAQKGRDFSNIAGQGVNPLPTNRVGAAPSGPTLPAGQGYPLPATQTAPPAPAYQALPFQQQAPPPGMAQPVPGTQAAPVAPAFIPGQPGAKPQTGKPTPATRAGKKAQTAKPEKAGPSQATSRPVSPGLTTPGGATVPGRKQAGAAPPVVQPAPPVSAPPAPGGATSLPALPPAMPYFPGRTQAPRPNVEPDEQGNVMARVPEYGQGGYGGGALPPAQAVTRPNPLGGFILDSFGRARPQAGQTPPGAQTPPSQTPPSNIFGQLNEDFQALGSGIRDTFSRILPGR